MSSKTRKSVALAFDLGGTKLNAGLVDSKGQILVQKKYLVDSKKIKSILDKAIQELALLARKNKLSIKGCGMASAGPMDADRGILINPANLPGIKKFEMVQTLKDLLKKNKIKAPVYFQNDAVAAALAEGWLGVAKNQQTYACITIGTGLGSGVIFKNQPLQNRGQGSEWGHAMYGDLSFEDIICGPAIIRRINSHFNVTLTSLRDLPESLTSEKDFFKIAFNPVVKATAAFCRTLSLGLYPETIAFSGGVMLVKKYFWKELNSEYKKIMAKFPSFIVPLQICHFENEAGLIGAASLVWQA